MENATQTEGTFVDSEQLNDYMSKYKELEAQYDELKEDSYKAMQEKNDALQKLRMAEEEAAAHQEALEHAHSSLNAEKRKCRQLQDERDELEAQMSNAGGNSDHRVGLGLIFLCRDGLFLYMTF